MQASTEHTCMGRIIGSSWSSVKDIFEGDESQKTPGYCWPTYIKVLGVLFLGEVSSAFLPSKEAC
jgi:hypothetical protein